MPSNSKNKLFICLVKQLSEQLHISLSEIPANYLLFVYSFLYFFGVKEHMRKHISRRPNTEQRVHQWCMKVVVPTDEGYKS